MDAKNVTHSQSVDGRAEPAILAVFGEARWFELGSAFARLGLRYLSGRAQEQIIISMAAICPHSKGKESLNLAYGLTRLRCLVRVSLGLKYKTSVLTGSYQETGKLLAFGAKVALNTLLRGGGPL